MALTGYRRCFARFYRNGSHCARVSRRDVSVYHLVTTRRDGSTGAVATVASGLRCAATERGPGGTAPANGSEPECQVSFRLSGGSMTISFKGETTSGWRARHPGTRSSGGRQDRAVGNVRWRTDLRPEPLPGFPRLAARTDCRCSPRFRSSGASNSNRSADPSRYSLSRARRSRRRTSHGGVPLEIPLAGPDFPEPREIVMREPGGGECHLSSV